MNLYLMERLRFGGGMIDMLETPMGLAGLKSDDIFSEAIRGRTRSSGAKLRQAVWRLNVHVNVFCCGVVEARNKLSAEVVNAEGVDVFKTAR